MRRDAESSPRTGTRAKAAPVVLRPKGKRKGQPAVKAMPKPKKMPRDAQLPPLKRMITRLTPRDPETPPPGHEETEVVLVEPDLLQGRGAEIPQPSTPPRRRPQEPSMPPPRGSAASSSGSGGRARRDWDDDRYTSATGTLEAAVLERHFDSIASIKGKRVQPPTRLWERREGGALWLSGMPTEESLASYSRWGRCRRGSSDAGLDFQEAQATVGRLRECQIYKLMEQGSIAQWIRHVRKTAVTGIRWPTPTGYIFTERSQIHLDLGRALPPPPRPVGSEVESWRAPVLADGPSPPYFFQHADAGRVKVSEADLDDLLDETALRDMKLQFWRRYKTRFPPELYRSDATLSRVTRELNKRMLCVFSVWKVKSLQFQLVSASKKRKLGENLFTEDQESCLGTGSPTLIGPAGRGDGVLLPSQALGLSDPAPEKAERLAWLQHRDTEERAVSSFQLGRSVNGKKVASVMKDGKRLCQDFQEGRCAEGT
eukprot:s10437_g1.t1